MRAAVLLPLEDDAPLRLALSLGAEEVVAVRAGPRSEADEAALCRALSLGASRVVRIWDPTLFCLDYLGLATILSSVVRSLDCRLVIAGDRGQGAVGPAVAERLDLPHLCGVLCASLTADPAEEGAAGSLLVKRRILGGTQELRGGRDAVLCVLSAAAPVAADPPATLPDSGRSENWGLEQVGLTAAELRHRRHLCAPTDAPVVLTAQPRPFDSARSLLARLRQDGLLRRR